LYIYSADELHQENVIYYGTLQTTTEHYVVLCSKIQPTDVAHFKKREFAADSEYLEGISNTWWVDCY
jgi:hypothetical protein